MLSSFRDEYRPFLGYTIEGVIETVGLFSEDRLEKFFVNYLKILGIFKPKFGMLLRRIRDEKRNVVKVGLGSSLIAV